MSQRTVTVEEARAMKAPSKRESKRVKDRAAADARRERYRVATEPVVVRLPFPPALNNYYRARVVYIKGKPTATIYISKKGVAYRNLVIDIWEQKIRVTFKGRLTMFIAAVFPDRRERDLDGLQKALFDALEHAGAYQNDSQIKRLIVDQKAIEAPGWVAVTLGMKPDCDLQKTLFDTEF